MEGSGDRLVRSGGGRSGGERPCVQASILVGCAWELDVARHTLGTLVPNGGSFLALLLGQISVICLRRGL